MSLFREESSQDIGNIAPHALFQNSDVAPEIFPRAPIPGLLNMEMLFIIHKDLDPKDPKVSTPKGTNLATSENFLYLIAPPRPNALLYEITPRVMDPAKPRPLHPEYVKQYLEVDDEQTKMKRARAYVPTERILKLAQPRHVTEKYRKQFVDANADVWKVKPEALKYKATKRIIELAKPRVYPEEEYFDPYKVKPSALRYKISERMLELAKPKGDPKNFQHNCFKDLY